MYDITRQFAATTFRRLSLEHLDAGHVEIRTGVREFAVSVSDPMAVTSELIDGGQTLRLKPWMARPATTRTVHHGTMTTNINGPLHIENATFGIGSDGRATAGVEALPGQSGRPTITIELPPGRKLSIQDSTSTVYRIEQLDAACQLDLDNNVQATVAAAMGGGSIMASGSAQVEMGAAGGEHLIVSACTNREVSIGRAVVNHLALSVTGRTTLNVEDGEVGVLEVHVDDSPDQEFLPWVDFGGTATDASLHLYEPGQIRVHMVTNEPKVDARTGLVHVCSSGGEGQDQRSFRFKHHRRLPRTR